MFSFFHYSDAVVGATVSMSADVSILIHVPIFQFIWQTCTVLQTMWSCSTPWSTI